MDGRETFPRQMSSVENDTDKLNDETFSGVVDNVSQLDEGWEKQHEQFSKILEMEHAKIKKSSPLRSSMIEIPVCNNRNYKKHILDSDDEEEEIIETSISQLNMDDEEDYIVRKTSNPVHSFEFKESEESWMSPSRGKDRHSDTLQELISPGDGIWASPSRSIIRDDDHIVPDIDAGIKTGEDIIKKLFGGHDIVTAKKVAPKSADIEPIRAEDLERGLRPEDDVISPGVMSSFSGFPHFNTSMPSPVAPAVLRHPFMSMPIGTPPAGIPFPNLTPRFSKTAPGVSDVNLASMIMMNQQFQHIGGIIGLGGLPPLYPNIFSPQMLRGNPFLFGADTFTQKQQHGTPRGRGIMYGKGYTNRGRGGRYNSNDKTWYRNGNKPAFDPDQVAHDQFVQMEPSKFMTAKEKEWIFKISLISLLSGDPNISDYYFISYMNKKLLKKALGTDQSKDEDDVSENLEKTKKLMSYAQKQQQSKEIHRPVKFEGSLGKLSIASVHHPRQIMDFATPEHEKANPRTNELGKKKFAMYGLIEKIYDVFLSLSDVERQLLDASPEEQGYILRERTSKIDKIFAMFNVKLHTSEEMTDPSCFLHLMSISKSRKLLPRVFIYFNQEQCESFFIAMLNILPTLLKKDKKEQSLLPVSDKVKIILKKSSEKFKCKCLKMFRKINLKLILSNKLSIKLLTNILESLIQKDLSHNMEWSFYHNEIPKVLLDLSGDIKKESYKELEELKIALDVNDLLIKIE